MIEDEIEHDDAEEGEDEVEDEVNIMVKMKVKTTIGDKYKEYNYYGSVDKDRTTTEIYQKQIISGRDELKDKDEENDENFEEDDGNAPIYLKISSEMHVGDQK